MFGQLNEKHQNSRVPLSSCSKRRSLAEVLQALSMTVDMFRSWAHKNSSSEQKYVFHFRPGTVSKVYNKF